ncbi:VOC family protein [Palleronia abyssalis]|uniref:Glyoxalase-like domain-containing protein n=1 Tax=Palleronia abyssalis TaxID=1501240 RepID=A0A2R8BVT3_9RHOB|nr:VOC family protein [Palleronia abyssalis]SPJ24233.1 hypothetical protein PAA8504_02061 [Palleronia abyssalis]
MNIDHIVITAPDLDTGAEAVHEALGVAPVQGGKHSLMGTHNRLLSLGPDMYLEVIAVDPDAPDPGRPRWFAMDRFSGPPRLTNWAAQADDMTRALAEAPMGMGELTSLTRGDLSWQMAIPPSGELPFDGVLPMLLSWQGRTAADLLSPSGCRLQRLILTHPRAGDIRTAWPRLAATDRLQIEVGPQPGLAAEIATPEGLKTLSGVIGN